MKSQCFSLNLKAEKTDAPFKAGRQAGRRNSLLLRGGGGGGKRVG